MNKFNVTFVVKGISVISSNNKDELLKNSINNLTEVLKHYDIVKISDFNYFINCNLSKIELKKELNKFLNNKFTTIII